MSLARGTLKRLRSIFRRGTAERELDAELRFHVEMEMEKNLRAGMRPPDARRAALMAFGGVERYREATRDARAGWLEAMRMDLRYSVRSLRREPGFAALAILTLALGIGTSTAVFSVVQSVLLRSLPYADADRITMIWSQWQGFPKTWVSVPEFRLYRREASSYEALALFQTGENVVTGGDVPRHVRTSQVTPNIFSVLGARPVAGRTFTEQEAREEAPVVVISHRLWSERFDEDQSAIGAPIVIDGSARTVIGVMPAGFKLPIDFAGSGETELWTAGFIPDDGPVDVPHAGGSHGSYVVGRLAPGVPVERARAEVESIVARLNAEGVYPASWQFRPLVVPVSTEVVGEVRPALLALFGAVAFVLLIACTNVANLLLSRLERRERELAVRTALGAGRGRLVRQLLTDSLVLAGLGAIGGVTIAWVLVRSLGIVQPGLLPSTGTPSIDAAVLLFALGASIVAAVLVGVLPALRVAEADLHEGLREGARGIGGRRAGRFRGALVVAQTAMAILLLVGAGLMMRTYAALTSIDTGLGADEVLTLRLATPAATYPQREDVVGFYRTVLERVRAIPGVASAGIVRLLPLASEIGDAGTVVEGYVPEPGETVSADWQFASPGYFESLGIPLVSGRTFREIDDISGAPVLIVNQAFVRKYLAGREPIGARVRIGQSSPWNSIVGIVADVTHNGITAEVKPMWYRPHAQFVEFSANVQRRMTLAVRGQGVPAEALEQPVLRTIRELDPAMPATEVRSIAEVRAGSVARPRFTLAILGAFSGLALIVAASGLYGVISYGVARRSRELGVRIALGARRVDVMSLIVRGGLAMVALGIGVGVLAATALTRFLETQLYGVTAFDLSTYASVCGVFLLVALAATWLPARRAAAVQPMEALRAD